MVQVPSTWAANMRGRLEDEPWKADNGSVGHPHKVFDGCTKSPEASTAYCLPWIVDARLLFLSPSLRACATSLSWLSLGQCLHENNGRFVVPRDAFLQSHHGFFVLTGMGLRREDFVSTTDILVERRYMSTDSKSVREFVRLVRSYPIFVRHADNHVLELEFMRRCWEEFKSHGGNNGIAFIGGPWFLRRAKALIRDMPDRVGVCTARLSGEMETGSYGFLGGSALGIEKPSGRKVTEAGHALLQYLVSAGAQRQYMNATGIFPGNLAALGAPQLPPGDCCYQTNDSPTWMADLCHNQGVCERMDGPHADGSALREIVFESIHHGAEFPAQTNWASIEEDLNDKWMTIWDRVANQAL